MSDDYNGWTNRETWAFAMHLNNDQGLQEWAHETVRATIEQWDRLNHRLSPVPAHFIGEALVDCFRESFDSGAYYAMLREIGSFWRIDVTEIGEAFLTDVREADGVKA